MPSWRSILGKWVPAKEYVVNPEAPKGKEIYEGPCRAAMQELYEQGEKQEDGTMKPLEFLGQDYHMNDDLLAKARTLGFNTIDDYLKERHGFIPDKVEKKQREDLAKTVVNHKNPERKSPIKEIGGGYSSGEATQFGNFGKPTNAPQIASKMKD